MAQVGFLREPQDVAFDSWSSLEDDGGCGDMAGASIAALYGAASYLCEFHVRAGGSIDTVHTVPIVAAAARHGQ